MRFELSEEIGSRWTWRGWSSWLGKFFLSIQLEIEIPTTYYWIHFITSSRSNLKWSDSPQSRLFQNSGAIQLPEVFLPVEHRTCNRVGYYLWNTGLETQDEKGAQVPHPLDFIWKFFIKLVLPRKRLKLPVEISPKMHYDVTRQCFCRGAKY